MQPACEHVVHSHFTNTVLVKKLAFLIFSESTISIVKYFKIESKMAAVKMTRKYTFPLIIVIVKHVLRNIYYRNTVLVFTPAITATSKAISATIEVISATTRVILATNKLVSASDKII